MSNEVHKAHAHKHVSRHTHVKGGVKFDSNENARRNVTFRDGSGRLLDLNGGPVRRESAYIILMALAGEGKVSYQRSGDKVIFTKGGKEIAVFTIDKKTKRITLVKINDPAVLSNLLPQDRVDPSGKEGQVFDVNGKKTSVPPARLSQFLTAVSNAQKLKSLQADIKLNELWNSKNPGLLHAFINLCELLDTGVAAKIGGVLQKTDLKTILFTLRNFATEAKLLLKTDPALAAKLGITADSKFTPNFTDPGATVVPLWLLKYMAYRAELKSARFIAGSLASGKDLQLVEETAFPTTGLYAKALETGEKLGVKVPQTAEEFKVWIVSSDPNARLLRLVLAVEFFGSKGAPAAEIRKLILANSAGLQKNIVALDVMDKSGKVRLARYYVFKTDNGVIYFSEDGKKLELGDKKIGGAPGTEEYYTNLAKALYGKITEVSINIYGEVKSK
jgi:hypothetical protein